jgi:hypothetical protein
MMTAPSTISPKSSAPRLIRFAETPAFSMPMLVSSIVIGITSAAISAARKLPSSTNSTTMTSTAPSARLRATVAIVELTSSVRLRTGFTTTSTGSARPISLSRLSTPVETVRLFSPIRITAVPTTTSWPFSEAEPIRNAWPVRTVAIWLSRIGTLSRVAITVRASSSALRIRPSARTARPSPLRSTIPAPALVLLRSSAVARSFSVIFIAAIRWISGTTRYCLV